MNLMRKKLKINSAVKAVTKQGWRRWRLILFVFQFLGIESTPAVVKPFQTVMVQPLQTVMVIPPKTCVARSSQTSVVKPHKKCGQTSYKKMWSNLIKKMC